MIDSGVKGTHREFRINNALENMLDRMLLSGDVDVTQLQNIRTSKVRSGTLRTLVV